MGELEDAGVEAGIDPHGVGTVVANCGGKAVLDDDGVGWDSSSHA